MQYKNRQTVYLFSYKFLKTVQSLYDECNEVNDPKCMGNFRGNSGDKKYEKKNSKLKTQSMSQLVSEHFKTFTKA